MGGLAELALERHSMTDVIEALGKQAPSVIPPLLFPADEPIRVTLPLYLRRLLEHLASREGVTVDVYLATIIHEYAEEISEPSPQQIEEAIPGFEAALAFPDEPEPLS